MAILGGAAVSCERSTPVRIAYRRVPDHRQAVTWGGGRRPEGSLPAGLTLYESVRTAVGTTPCPYTWLMPLRMAYRRALGYSPPGEAGGAQRARFPQDSTPHTACARGFGGLGVGGLWCEIGGLDFGVWWFGCGACLMPSRPCVFLL